MGKLAILFAGQGAQYDKMGYDLYQKYPEVQDLYLKASDVLGYDLTDICFTNNDKINQTKYTQPSILVTSIAIYTILQRELEIKPDYLAGFSLGEYSALYASGIFDFKTIVDLIKKRAYFMEEAAEKNKGSMAAIIGMERNKLEQLCSDVEKTTGIVKIANYNCPNQLVISGEVSAVNSLCEKAKENGAKRAITLNVSGGFHTVLMESAAKRMYEAVLKVKRNKPTIDIYMNCNAEILDINELPELMEKQIKSSVYFEDSIRKMIDNGVDTFIEIGPGKVLSGFVRKIDRTKKVISINDLNDFGGALDEFRK